ncbi:hypothetical protein [Micromonospora sp. DT47]|uniref:hypothetical protein n=1 Tax=Micromonospora sp. DT47 TaxID=3393431 RepID=UPI003CF2E49B
MSKVIMGCAAVSIDGSIANESDEVGPLFDWAGNGAHVALVPMAGRLARHAATQAPVLGTSPRSSVLADDHGPHRGALAAGRAQ